MRNGVIPHEGSVQMRAVVAGRTAENSVVVFRKDLRLLQRLVTACRAADEVRALRGPPVERRDERLSGDGHLMR